MMMLELRCNNVRIILKMAGAKAARISSTFTVLVGFAKFHHYIIMSSPLFPWVEPQQSNLSRLKRRHGNLSSSTRHNVTGRRQDCQDVVMNALSVLEYIKGMEQSMVVMCMIEMKG